MNVGAGRNRQVRFTSNVLRTVGILNDVVCFVAAFGASSVIYDIWTGHYFDPRQHAVVAFVLAINFFLIRISSDGYSEFRGQGEEAGQGTIGDFLLAVTLTGVTIVQFEFIKDFLMLFALLYVCLCVAMLFFSRILFRKFAWLLMERGIIGQRVVVYGSERAVTTRLLELLELERIPHVRVIGFADDRKTRIDTSSIGDIPYLGGFDALLKMAQVSEIDQVIIALPRVAQERLDAIAEALSSASIDICIMPREFLELRTRYRMSFLGSLPVLAVWQQPIRDIDGATKELQDRSLAALALIGLSPLLLLVAIAIKLESRGPVLFRQRRFGFNNVEISVLKFRSMYVDQQDASGAQRTTSNDSRVTIVGRFIRRFSIDELPQLFNVLRGDMSLVGPRPHATQMRVGDKFYFDAVQGYAARHRVKPGITGLAQVRGLRGEIATIERARRRVEYDVYYIENWSPLLDARIILETLFKVVWDRHAY